MASHRVFNFSAGPSTLPVPVLERAAEEMLDYGGTGMGVMEMSHRSPPFEEILRRAKADVTTLLGIPANYKVLFLQGGATQQFAMVPMTFLRAGQVGRYVLTGAWGKKAIESAQVYGDTETAFDGRADNYRDVPTDLPGGGPNVAYTHLTSNETIQGVQFATDPGWSGDLVCDMSSDILSRPADISKYAMVYAGAQKNMGPAGVTLVILREDMLERVPGGMAPIFDYKIHVENDSMYNTPPTFAIYICGLVYKHLLETGGLAGAQTRNRRKAALIYDAIDTSNGFYRGHAACGARSTMNVTFTLANDDLTKAFVKGAEARDMDGLKGHRSVGGIRASIYNAFPEAGCVALAEYMREFAVKNG